MGINPISYESMIAYMNENGITDIEHRGYLCELVGRLDQHCCERNGERQKEESKNRQNKAKSGRK